MTGRIQEFVSNVTSHTGVMAPRRAPWAPPLAALTGGIVGHLLAWERQEHDRTWWAWGVLGAGDQRQAHAQGGLGAGREPAPAGAARSVQGGAAAGTRLRWADPRTMIIGRS